MCSKHIKVKGKIYKLKYYLFIFCLAVGDLACLKTGKNQLTGGGCIKQKIGELKK